MLNVMFLRLISVASNKDVLVSNMGHLEESIWNWDYWSWRRGLFQWEIDNLMDLTCLLELNPICYVKDSCEQIPNQRESRVTWYYSRTNGTVLFIIQLQFFIKNLGNNWQLCRGSINVLHQSPLIIFFAARVVVTKSKKEASQIFNLVHNCLRYLVIKK